MSRNLAKRPVPVIPDLPRTCWRSYKHDGWPHFDGVDESAIPRIYNPECPEHGQGITE
jgi:hypothetical protein